MNLTIDLTGLRDRSNSAYVPMYRNHSRFLVLYGGAGSGKSRFAAHKIIYRILTERRHKILVIRKVANTLRNSVFDEIKKAIAYFGIDGLATVNKSDMTITLPALKSQIIFLGCDDVEKLKSISGVTSVWIEEATELAENDLTQINLRLRGNRKSYYQIILTFNPISDLHWLKKRFFDTPEPSATALKTTYRDNKYLDAEYVSELEAMRARNSVYHAIYAEGDWGQLSGLVFTNWETVTTLPESFDAMYYGLDFGYNDPSAYIEIGIKDDVLYIVKEVYIKHLTNTELISILVPVVPSKAVVVADAAEPARIMEFIRSGINAQAALKGQSSVKDGIDFLRSKTIKVHADCVNTIRELQMYTYREDRDGNSMEEPIGYNDHAIAAMRYAIESLRLGTSVKLNHGMIVRGPQRDKW